MSLRDDIMAAFEKRGLKFVSLNESSVDPKKSTLLYLEGSGKSASKEINIPISELEDTLSTLELMDPDDLANFLLQ